MITRLLAIPPEPPVATASPAQRRAVGKGAPILRGVANPCSRAPLCDPLTRRAAWRGGGHPAGEFRAGFGKLRWRPVGQAAVRPFAVIFHPPTLDLPLRVGQVHEPTRIQALIPKPPVEALYVAILHRLARLDMNHRDALLFAPRQEVPPGELRPVVAAHRFRLAALGNDPLQHARYLLAANPRADLDRRTLPCVAVDDRERPQSA